MADQRKSARLQGNPAESVTLPPVRRTRKAPSVVSVSEEGELTDSSSSQRSVNRRGSSLVSSGRKSVSSSSSIARMRLQAQLKVEEEFNRLEKEREDQMAKNEAKRQERLKRIKMKIAMAEIDEEEDGTDYADSDSQKEVDEENVAKKTNGLDRASQKHIEEWVDSVKIVPESVPIIPPQVPKVITTTEGQPSFEQPPVHQENKVQVTTPEENIVARQSSPNTEGGEMRKFIARQSVARDLPVFSGDPESWPMFISQFRGTTAACDFTDFENMTRLEKALRGRAKEAVKSLMLIPTNVEKVIKILQINFGRPGLIVETMLTKAKSIANPREDRPETLIDFANAVGNLVSTMETLNETGHMRNPTLLRELVDKLPNYERKSWADVIVKTQESATLKMLADWLETRAEAASLLTNPKIYSESKPYQEEKKQKNPRGRGKDVLVVTGENDTKVKEKLCLFCTKTNHYITDCHNFKKETEEQRWIWANEKNVCFSCLKSGHRIFKCLRKVECKVNGCKSNHHPLLHKKEVVLKPEEVSSKSEGATSRTEEDNIQVNTEVQNWKPLNRILMQIVPVILTGPKGKISTFAYLDSGASATIMKFSVAEKLGVKGEKVSLNLNWIAPVKNNSFESTSVALKIQGKESDKEFQLQNVRTVNTLKLPEQTTNIQALVKKWPHLNKIKFKDLEDAEPTILIGEDNANLIIAREVIEGPGNSPILSRSHLGWVLHGNTSEFKGRVDSDFMCTTWQDQLDELDRLVKDSFSTENFGVKVLQQLPKTKLELRADKLIEENMKLKNNRWETGLLWKEDYPQLPLSKMNALHRLKIMERKMDKNPQFGIEYCKKIEDYLSKGYARKLSEEEANVQSPTTWYLPHFGVLNPNKPGKLRLVFDAAAKSNGTSLNENLMAGPDKLTPLIGVLLRFREKQIGFCADIAEMFLQVKIREEDLPAQRFLWRGMERVRPPETYVMTVMTFGATCSPCLAQEAKNRNASLHEKEYPEAAKAILHHHYVDDYLDCTDDVGAAIKKINDVIYVHQQGGFQLVNWTCSNRQVLDKLPEQLRANKVRIMESKEELPVERVLGLYWDPNLDVFTFTCKFNKVKPEILEGVKRPTKRETLQLVNSVYDPLGFVSLFTIKGKIIIQDIWRSGIDWDEEVSEDIFVKWKIWLEELRKIPDVKIPRCYIKEWKNIVSTQLHIYCDASEQAYSVVSYIRVETKESVHTVFVMSRARVTALKPISIPKNELQAAVMGSRLSTTLRKELNLKIDTLVLWSDSTTVLDWLRSDARKQQTFIACRIGEILETTNIENWRWVPSAENPADEATRDVKYCDISPTSMWINGPAYLKLPMSEWPQEPVKRKQNAGDGSQESKDRRLSVQVDISNVEEDNVFVTQIVPAEIIDMTRISSWPIMKRTWARILRFINNCRMKKENRSHGILKVAELEKAEQTGIKWIQWQTFPDEMAELSKGKSVSKNSKLYTLSPYLDEDGLLRMKGRLQQAPDICRDVKNPLILESKCHATKLLIMYYHEKFKHQGKETVINEIRQKFWILKIRIAVNKVWNDCQVCRIRKAKPEVPLMGQLPAERLTRQTRPFVFTGVDYFGPLIVTVRRSTEKRYGALFTCLTTRAVHMELASSLNTDAAIMAVRRFIARRGCPTKMFSDNGTNFHGANRELQEAWKELDREELQSDMAERGIEWHFIPPSSPNFGGCWERLVKSVKTALYATLKERAPKEEILYTLLLEAENVVNSHPLTHVSVDIEDQESLTPNHFLIGSSSASPLPGKFDKSDLCLRKQWRACQRMTDLFWTRWVREYLPTLARRTKWHGVTNPVKVGDLVFIADGNLSRNLWPRGKVTAVFPGKDGIIRTVDVKTQNGLLRRPVSKICILDVSSKEEGVAAKSGVPEKDPQELEGVCRASSTNSESCAEISQPKGCIPEARYVEGEQEARSGTSGKERSQCLPRLQTEQTNCDI